ncbi:condensin-2 complex subunit CAP-D3 [Typha latifolia]|uniref:condensin-2 complex subunit CAP-D3 n=1 Tax=Typha latifolia TaxID=4733 RepID=UPI003C2B598F
MEEDDDVSSPEALSHLVSSLASFHHLDSPISYSSLSSLLSFLSGDGAAALWTQLAARNLPISALIRPISAAMESSSSSDSHLSLLASLAYLSLLLSPSSPLHSLFSPLAFLSLLRSLRRSLKPVAVPDSPKPRKNSRKRKSDKAHPAVSASDPESDVADLVVKVLRLLVSVLGRVRLDSFPDARKSVVETMVAVLDTAVGRRHQMSDLCFLILENLVSRPEHGEQIETAIEVFQSLTPMILAPMKSPTRAAVLGFVVKKMVPLGQKIDGIRKTLMYLPRFLAMKTPEKADPRACAVDAIMEIVRAMECEDRIGFMEYVVKMTQGKAQLRLLAVDLIFALLTSLHDPLGVKDLAEEVGSQWGIRCLKALVERCWDSVGGIRARALVNLAHIIGLLSEGEENRVRLQKVMGIGNADLSKMLRRRCIDEKAAVRKAALLLVTKSIALIGLPIDEVLLETIGASCSDPLVSIRKAALAALSEVFRRFPDQRVTREWLHAVLPLIVDNETSIQEECENLFLELVLNRISQSANVSLSSDAAEIGCVFPEGVLDLLRGIYNGEVAPCVRKICTSLGKKKRLKPLVARSLQNIITTSESLWLRSSKSIEKWTAPPGAWQLLSEVSPFTPKAIDWKFLCHHWKLLDNLNLEEQSKVSDGGDPNSVSWAGDRVSLLQTISNVSLELPVEPAAELAHNLLSRIENFNLHLSEVDAHVKSLRTLCKRKATIPEEANTLILKWVHQLLSKALEILDVYLSEVSEAGKVNHFLTPPQGGRKKEKAVSASMLKAVAAVFTIGSLVLACPSADLQGITPLLHTIITSGNTEPKAKKLVALTVSFKEVAPSLYIQSWVTMGKICLVDDNLAKQYIPLFIQELERSDCPALRNNIMVAMADFCVRYTALVDCYIPRIAMSLRDPCEVVRRQTFILLSRLLQRDYVKWRGVLFLQFLLCLVDDSEKIRHLADFLFGSILKVKAPLLAYNSFIEAILVLNDCHAHSGHSEIQGSSQAAHQPFAIRGTDETSRSQRMHIYVSLLKQMAPEHLLATSAKICAEILAAASDGLLNVDDVTGQAVLQDALQILACKEMRIQTTRGSDTSEMDDEGGDSGGTKALLAAKGRVVTEVAKKNLIQIAVPIFIELKRLLESKTSPLTGCLMDCLRILLKDYKNEIDEILVADKQLQKELLYDMQKYDAAKAKSTVAEAVSNAQGSDSHSLPDSMTASRIHSKISDKLGSGANISSALADAAAEATVRSVLKEVNRDAATPPLHSMSVPKLKSGTANAGVSTGGRSSNVLESLRCRQSFESDEEN